MEIYCSEEVKQLASAMLKVQSELCTAIKDAENPYAKSKYASLNSVISASRVALLKYGIWLVQYPIPTEPGHLGLVTKLIHGTSGEWQSSLLVMPLSKNDPQGFGSAMTYARRYSIASLIGLVVEDDDAEGACERSKNKKVHGSAGKEKDYSNAEVNSSAQPKTGQNTIKNPSENEAPEAKSDLPDNLPHLEGISYQKIKAQDGAICIIATGNTHAKKDILSSTGFKWNANRKIWWRYADAA